MKQKELAFVNCDVSEFDSLEGCTIESIITCGDSIAEGFFITAYREISGVKIYRQYMRDEGEYYISAEYIPDSEKEEIAKKVNHDL